MKKLRGKFLKFIVIPGILLGIWLGLTFLYVVDYDDSFTVVSFNHSKDDFIEKPEGKLLKGNKISGEFTAYQNNLGIVVIRFKQEQRIPWRLEDVLLFRIKEKGKSEWYSQNEYYSGLMQEVPFFPMGFPIIKDSLGKHYYFELESTKGNNLNGTMLSNKRPILTTRYQIDKQEAIQNPNKAVDIIMMKLVNSFTTPDILFSSIVYALPFFLYVTWLTGIFDSLFDALASRFLPKYAKSQRHALMRKIVRSNHFFAVSIVLIGIVVLYDVFRLQVLNDGLYIVVMTLWITVLSVTKQVKTISVWIAALLLTITPIALQLNNKSIAEKAAAWALIFLATFILREIFVLFKKPKRKSLKKNI